MRRFDHIVISVVVGLPLVFGLAARPFVTPNTEDLNRPPVGLPNLGPGDLLDPDTYAGIAGWLGDRIAFRRDIRAAEAWIDDRIFDDAGSATVIAGRDGWLYLEQALARGAEPDFDPHSVRDGLVALKRKVEAAGKTFLFVYAPHKPTIYPGNLSRHDQRRQANARARLEEFRALMREEPVPGFIDVWDEMTAAADTAPEPLYHARDTHWTALGASVLARAVVDRLDPGLAASLVATPNGTYSKVFDLARMRGETHSDEATRWHFSRPGVRVEEVAEANGEDLRTRQYRAESDDDAALLPKTAVIADSYGAALTDPLSPFFRMTSLIQPLIEPRNLSGPRDLARKALQGADIVLFVRVERALWISGRDAPFANTSEPVLALLDTLKDHGQGHQRRSRLTGERTTGRGSDGSADPSE